MNEAYCRLLSEYNALFYSDFTLNWVMACKNSSELDRLDFLGLGRDRIRHCIKNFTDSWLFVWEHLISNPVPTDKTICAIWVDRYDSMRRLATIVCLLERDELVSMGGTPSSTSMPVSLAAFGAALDFVFANYAEINKNAGSVPISSFTTLYSTPKSSTPIIF